MRVKVGWVVGNEFKEWYRITRIEDSGSVYAVGVRGTKYPNSSFSGTPETNDWGWSKVTVVKPTTIFIPDEHL